MVPSRGQLAHPPGPIYHKRIVPSTYQHGGRTAPTARCTGEPRADSRRRRELAFAEIGIDVSVEEIAHRAGVGMGTLYRRFPTKDALIDAVFEQHLDRIAASAEAALAEPRRLDGIPRLPDRRRQAAGERLRALADPRRLPERGGSRREGAHPPAAARAAADRARAGSGELRPDVVYEDISVLLWTTGRVVDATRDVEPDFWQRYLALAVDGLRASSATPLPRPPLTAAKHRQAMTRFAEHRSRTSR